MQVTLLGAGGFLGLNLVDTMLAAGLAPRCVHRPRGNLIPLRRRGVPMVAAELGDPASLGAALAGSEVVVHLAGHYPRDARHAEATFARGRRETEGVLAAAHAAGVRRLVYVSSTATTAARADGRPSTEADVFPAIPGHGVYHDLKWTMEQTVLAETRFEVAVACPGACIGPWDLKVGTAALLVATAHDRCPPHPDGVVNLVDVRDVARGLLALVTHPAPPRRVLLSGRTLRLQELLIELANHYGTRPPPPALAAEAAMAFADAEETRVAGTAERAAIAREIVDLVVHGVPIDATLATRALGIAWTPFANTLAAFDAWATRMRFIPAATAAPSLVSEPS